MSATAFQCNKPQDALYMAMELSTSKWLLAFSTGAARDPRIREVPARSMSRLRREIDLARMYDSLQPGDVVLADALFDNYFIVCALR